MEGGSKRKAEGDLVPFWESWYSPRVILKRVRVPWGRRCLYSRLPLFPQRTRKEWGTRFSTLIPCCVRNMGSSRFCALRDFPLTNRVWREGPSDNNLARAHRRVTPDLQRDLTPCLPGMDVHHEPMVSFRSGFLAYRANLISKSPILPAQPDEIRWRPFQLVRPKWQAARAGLRSRSPRRSLAPPSFWS